MALQLSSHFYQYHTLIRMTFQLVLHQLVSHINQYDTDQFKLNHYNCSIPMYEKYQIKKILQIGESHEHYFLITQKYNSSMTHIIHQTLQPYQPSCNPTPTFTVQIQQSFQQESLFHYVLQSSSHYFLQPMSVQYQISNILQIMNIVNRNIQIYPHNLVRTNKPVYYFNQSLREYFDKCMATQIHHANIIVRPEYKHIFNFAYTIYILLLSSTLQDFNIHLKDSKLLLKITESNNMDRSLFIILKSCLLIKDGQVSLKMIEHSLLILKQRQKCQIVLNIFQSDPNTTKIKSKISQNQQINNKNKNHINSNNHNNRPNDCHKIFKNSEKLKHSTSLTNLNQTHSRKCVKYKKLGLKNSFQSNSFYETSPIHNMRKQNYQNNFSKTFKQTSSSFHCSNIFQKIKSVERQQEQIYGVNLQKQNLKKVITHSLSLQQPNLQTPMTEVNGVSQSIKQFSLKIATNVINQTIQNKIKFLNINSKVYQINLKNQNVNLQSNLTKDNQNISLQKKYEYDKNRQVTFHKSNQIENVTSNLKQNQNDKIKNNERQRLQNYLNVKYQIQKKDQVDILMDNTNFLGQVMDYLNKNLGKQKNYWYFFMYILYEKQCAYYQLITKYKKINNDTLIKLNASLSIIRKNLSTKPKSYMSSYQIQTYLQTIQSNNSIQPEQAIKISLAYFKKMSDIIFRDKIKLINETQSLCFWLKHLFMVTLAINIIDNPLTYQLPRKELSYYENYVDNSNLGLISIDNQIMKIKCNLESEV